MAFPSDFTQFQSDSGLIEFIAPVIKLTGDANADTLKIGSGLKINGIAFGYVATNTIAGSLVIIPHGLGFVPISVFVTNADFMSPYLTYVQPGALDATNITCRIRDGSTGNAAGAGVAVGIFWLAIG